MSLRRNRSHKIGVSNIDYRTKRDEENLRIFEPWQAPRDFGTMGNKNYYNPPKIAKNLFSPTARINTHKDIVNDYPDPRYFTTAKFYKANHIDIKTKSFINSERVGNIEETFKGKDVFTGDGMGITEIIKQRKTKQKNLVINLDLDLNLLEEHKQQQHKNKLLAIEKKKLNKNVPIETQLVKIEAQKTGNNLVDINKIQEIRQTIRRRYGNRKNINKVFQQWAKTFPNKITAYDAYRMINSLFIPINYNEAKALVASASNLGEDFINLSEFSYLIYNDNERMNLEPYIVKPNENNFFDEEAQKNLNQKAITNRKQINDSSNLKILKEFICHREIPLMKNIKELSKEGLLITNNYKKNPVSNKIDFDKFSKAIKGLNPPENFTKEEYLESLFNEYKDKDNLIDIRMFFSSIYDKHSDEFLSKLKDGIHFVHQDQIAKRSNSLTNFVKDNISTKDLVFQKKYDLDKQILLKKQEELKKKEEEEKEPPEVNGTVPSTPWIHKIYDNRKEHYNILNRAEHALSAKPIMRQNHLKTQTRFSANPKWRNTAEILIGDAKAPTYISERDRFILDRNIGQEEKNKKEKVSLGRQNRIRTAIQKAEQSNFMIQYLKEEKEKYSQLEKCKKQFDYEERLKNLNNIVE